ncbi:MAG: hypothetical protein JW846_06780 [Dehalococcoidia bacterium]|nr:hypothetical protein [Dehalococcoidia bacterium]
MRYHKLFAILATAGFVGHLAANLLIDISYWLPEYIWFGSVAFAVLAIYAGAITATRGEQAERGTAIASAVIGTLILLGLMYSGITWLFLMDEMLSVPVSIGL